jgi:hypothetical protein
MHAGVGDDPLPTRTSYRQLSQILRQKLYEQRFILVGEGARWRDSQLAAAC